MLLLYWAGLGSVAALHHKAAHNEVYSFVKPTLLLVLYSCKMPHLH
jgi:hypothetical protein